MITASWVIRELATGRVIMETFNDKMASAINAATATKYEAVPIQQYLGSLNAKAPQ